MDVVRMRTEGKAGLFWERKAEECRKNSCLMNLNPQFD